MAELKRRYNKRNVLQRGRVVIRIIFKIHKMKRERERERERNERNYIEIILISYIALCTLQIQAYFTLRTQCRLYK